MVPCVSSVLVRSKVFDIGLLNKQCHILIQIVAICQEKDDLTLISRRGIKFL